MYIRKKMFVSCSCVLTKVKTKLVFKGHCAIGQKRQKEREKKEENHEEENHEKENEETFSSLFHGKHTG